MEEREGQENSGGLQVQFGGWFILRANSYCKFCVKGDHFMSFQGILKGYMVCFMILFF